MYMCVHFRCVCVCMCHAGVCNLESLRKECLWLPHNSDDSSTTLVVEKESELCIGLLEGQERGRRFTKFQPSSRNQHVYICDHLWEKGQFDPKYN